MNTQNQITLTVKTFGSDWTNVRDEYMSLYDNGTVINLYFTEVEGQYTVSERELQQALFNESPDGYMDGLIIPPRGSRQISQWNGWITLLLETVVYCEGLKYYNELTRRGKEELVTAIQTGLMCPVDNLTEIFPNGGFQSPNLPDFAWGAVHNSYAQPNIRVWHTPTQKYYDF